MTLNRNLKKTISGNGVAAIRNGGSA